MPDNKKKILNWVLDVFFAILLGAIATAACVYSAIGVIQFLDFCSRNLYICKAVGITIIFCVLSFLMFKLVKKWPI